MPTVLRTEGYRFYFYSHEPGEPPHVHVDKGAATAKIWLHDGGVARSVGFGAPELGKIQRLVRDKRVELKEAWDAFFRTGK
ncbi:DUF4160 domain-containing protein [Rhodocyclaceae bacterium SMB388]